MITHETLILAAPGLPDGVGIDAFLSAIAEVEAQCAHSYFVEHHVKGCGWNKLKSELARRFGLTHRQFSSVASWVDGMAKGVREGMKHQREDLTRRIRSAEDAISKCEKQRKASVDKDQRHHAWRARKADATAAGRRGPALPKSLHGYRPGDEAERRENLQFKIHITG